MMFEYDDEYDEGDVENSSAHGADGKLRVLTEQCSTCIFRPGNLMHLEPGRVKQMCDASVAGGGYITCHQTLPYGEHPDFGGAVCRGFYDAHGHRSNIIRIMQRFDGITEVAPPAKENQ